MKFTAESTVAALTDLARERFPHIAMVEAVPSSNGVLWDMLKAGYGDGTVVIAQSQTGGRGRLGRTWESPPGNLYMSVLRRMAETPEKAGIVSLLAGIAVAQSVAAEAGVSPALKWPNDVLIGRRKLAGILLEARDDWQVVGIGVNVNCTVDSLGPELSSLATTLLEETGRHHDLASLAGGVLNVLAELEAQFTQEQQLPVEKFTDYFPFLGTRVQVQLDGRTLEGSIESVEPDGTLVLKDDLNLRHNISSGEVKHVR